MSSMEHTTVAACRFEQGQVTVSTDESWQRHYHDDATAAAAAATTSTTIVQPAIWSASESSIRIAPMSRLSIPSSGRRSNKNSSSKKGPPRWSSDLHFHPDLQLPVPSSPMDTATAITTAAPTTSLVCLWQAKARECVRVALSPRPGYVRGHTFEITFGAIGNTHTALEKQHSSSSSSNIKKKTKNVSVLSHVCHEQVWTSYWVCLVQQQQQQQQHPNTELSNIKYKYNNKLYAGVGSIPGKQCIAILNDVVDDDDDNSGSQKITKTQDKEEREGPEQDATVSEQECSEKDDQKEEQDDTRQKDDKPPIIRCVGFGNSGIYDRQAPAPLLVRNICLTTATEELLATLDSLSPDTLETIVLGMDNNDDSVGTMATMMSEETKTLFQEYQEECRKNKARAQKFGVPYVEPAPDSFMAWSQARRLRANPKAGFATGLDLQDPAEKAKQEARRKRFGLESTTTTAAAAASGEQGQLQAAGTRMEGVESKATAGVESEGISVEQAWDNEELVKGQRADPPPSLWKIPPSEAEMASQKPSSSTDNEFGTIESPTLVPEKIHIFSIDWAAFKQIRTNDIMSYFSIYGPSYVEWLGDLSCNVLFEDQYSAARAMQHLSQELVSPVPDDIVSSREEEEEDAEPPTDFGRQGWHLGKTLLRKVSNDRYGRRGTTARLLMRVATSQDILHERPTSWPKPPPGFSTKRVLGPGSDFGKGPRANKKKKNKRRRIDNDSNQTSSSRPYDPNSALDSGLSAGRAGFSVEEMEAERAQKKAKT